MTEIAKRPRLRAESLDFRQSRDARDAVQSLNAPIGQWQVQAVRLVALGTKLRQTGRHEPRLSREAEVLLKQVERQRAELRRRAESLPEEIRLHSRFTDAVRALDSLEAGAREAAALLNAKT